MRIGFIFSHKMFTRLMQDADIFEPFKVLVVQKQMFVTINSLTTPEYIQSKMAELSVNWNSNNESEFAVIACYDMDHVYWVDPSVKVVSTGTNWTMFDDYLKYHQQNFASFNDKNSQWHLGLSDEQL